MSVQVYEKYLSFVVIIGIISAVLQHTHGQDLVKRRTSNVCRLNTDCSENAFCEHNNEQTDNGQCVCNERYISISENKTRSCYKAGEELGDPCIFDDQCKFTFSTDAECRDGKCECKEGSHFVPTEATCYKSVKIGEYCRLSNNCVGEGTICRSGLCYCPLETHSNDERNECIPDRNLGHPCALDEECVAEHSRCHNVCRCKASHILSKDASRCLRAAGKLFDECEEDNQCLENIPFSTCILKTFNSAFNATCACSKNYHEINYRCYVSVELRGICEDTENCLHTPNSECVAGRCVCQSGFDNAGGYCSSTAMRATLSFKLIILLVLITLVPKTISSLV